MVVVLVIAALFAGMKGSIFVGRFILFNFSLHLSSDHSVSSQEYFN